jgi:hypothetical protein
MNKPSPLTWYSKAKVDAWNYGYRRPMSAVQIKDEKSKWDSVQSRCEPHVNCLDFPPRQKVEDYSWVHEAPPIAKTLPPEHPLSPKRLKERDQAERAAALAAQGLDTIPEANSAKDSRSVRSSAWGKDNPNTADFSLRGGSKKGISFKKESSFGEVEKFTAHRAGGHYSSKTKSLLEITRKDEIDLQRERDIAEAKAKLILSGGRLV